MTGKPDPRVIQAIQDATARFRSGESDEEAVRLPGGEILRMVRDPDRPMGMRIEGITPGAPPAIESAAFPSSASPPEGFPDDIPFIAGCMTTITRMEAEDGLFVGWLDVEHAEQRFDELHERLTGAGWFEEPIDPDDPSHATIEQMVERGWDLKVVRQALARLDDAVRSHQFYRDGLVRTLTLTHAPSLAGINLYQRRVAEKGN
jgi:hypothetical protein